MNKDHKSWWRQLAKEQGKEERESFQKPQEEPSFNERLKIHEEDAFHPNEERSNVAPSANKGKEDPIFTSKRDPRTDQSSQIGLEALPVEEESAGKGIARAGQRQAASNEIAAAAGKSGMITQAAQTAAKGFRKIAESARQDAASDKDQKSDVSSKIAIYVTVFLLLFGPILLLMGLLGTRTAAGWGNEIAEVAENEYKRANEEGEVGGVIYRSWDMDTWNWLERCGIAPNWCAIFVSWCGEQLGYCSSGFFPKTWSVYAYTDWFHTHSDYGEIHHHDTYIPERGDLVIYDWNGTGAEDHIEIVTEYDSSTGTMTSIGGNTGNAQVPIGGRWCDYSLVAKHSFVLNASVIWGYIHPNYESFTGDQTKAEGNEK